jgi:transcriptional regulator with XRE-family HTH domain
MSGAPVTVGVALATARKAAGLSLRRLGEQVGLSVPFLHDVEHDRRPLAPAHWPGIVAACPSLTLRALAEASIAKGPIRIDARLLTPEQRSAIVDALTQEAAA